MQHKSLNRDPADIVADLHKRNLSLAQLALANNYASGTALQYALRKPYPKAEKVIADALGVKPESIWPDRYLNGKPNRTGGRKPMTGLVAA